MGPLDTIEAASTWSEGGSWLMLKLPTVALKDAATLAEVEATVLKNKEPHTGEALKIIGVVPGNDFTLLQCHPGNIHDLLQFITHNLQSCVQMMIRSEEKTVTLWTYKTLKRLTRLEFKLRECTDETVKNLNTLLYRARGIPNHG